MANRYQGRSFRTDDYDRDHGAAAQSQGESDPLAELARLIGQADPFANVSRDNPSRAAREPEATAFDADDRREPDFEASPGPPSWMQRVAQRDPDPRDYDEAPQAETPYADEHTPGAHYTASQPEYDDSAAQSRGPYDYNPPEQYTAPQGYDQTLDPSRYDDALYGAPDHSDNQRYYPETDGYPHEGYDQQGYDENAAVRKPRRGGMMTVVVVLALAVVGTAAAYGYRTFAGSPRNGEAPIIKADAGPTKIVPQNSSSDASSKAIQDRVTTPPGTERIVSREEQPLDVNAKAGGPRVVFPPLAPNPNVGAAPVTQASRQLNSGAANVVPGDEPRKIKTVSIHPDQVDTAPTSNSPAVTAAQPGRAPAQARAVQPASPTSPAPNNAPMSLSPQAAAGAQAMAVPPASAASTGGYLVQISSQGSESDAKNSYRTLQGKFPSVLGSRQPVIQRADLGDKGVHYRAMVGPFETRDEAAQFCSSLKSVGGNCFIPRK